LYARVPELLLERLRLRVALARVRLPHVQRNEGHPITKLLVKPFERRTVARHHRAGDRGEGEQQRPPAGDVALAQAIAVGRRQVEFRHWLARRRPPAEVEAFQERLALKARVAVFHSLAFRKKNR